MANPPAVDPQAAALLTAGPGANPSAEPTADANATPSAPATQQTSTPANIPGVTPPPAPEQTHPGVMARIATVGRHAELGRIADKLFTGGTEYQTTPDGQIVAVQGKRPTGGDIFKSILGSALLGLSAGSGATDFASGLGKGYAASTAQRQAQDQQNFARAQNALVNQRAQQDANDKHILTQAQLAHLNIESYQYVANADLQSPQNVSKANAAYQSLSDAADASGAQDANIKVGDWENGTPGNARGFHEAYAADPAAFKAPVGFHNVENIQIDTHGLKFDQHTDPTTGKITDRWLNPDGSPADLDDRTTITFKTVPIPWFTEIQSYSGAGLNSANPTLHLDPDASFPLTGGQYLQTVHSGIKALNQDTANKNKPTRRANSGDPQVNAAVDKILSSNASAADQIAALENTTLSPSQKIAGRKLLKTLGPKAPNAKTQAPNLGGTTVVIAPDGSRRTVQNSQLAAAIAAGGKVAQ